MATIIQLLEQILTSIDPLLSNETKRIHLKEALQSFILDYIYNHPNYRGLNLYGGTCLHIIYGLNRLSEDIDLDNSKGVDISSMNADLEAHFKSGFGYPDVTIKHQESKQGIIRNTLRFPVLGELGLSPHRTENLHIKVEISQHSQVAVIKHTPVIQFGRSYVPSHFSLETMMSGKMIACLERSFEIGSTGALVKGRDFYDLLWFMQQKIHPLEEKLEKDGSVSYSTERAMLALQQKVKKIKQTDLAVDLLPLFDQRIYIERWISSFHENFEEYLQYYL